MEKADDLELTPEDLKQADQEFEFAPDDLDLSDVQLGDAEADDESFLDVVPAAKRAEINIYEDDDPFA